MFSLALLPEPRSIIPFRVVLGALLAFILSLALVPDPRIAGLRVPDDLGIFWRLISTQRPFTLRSRTRIGGLDINMRVRVSPLLGTVRFG